MIFIICSFIIKSTTSHLLFDDMSTTIGLLIAVTFCSVLGVLLYIELRNQKSLLTQALGFKEAKEPKEKEGKKRPLESPQD